MRTLALATRTGVLAATTGALLFTGAAAQGTALAAPQAPKAKLTVQDYRAFLKKGGGSSATLLKSFDGLPKAKQQKFVGYLQSAAVQKAFDAALGGYVTTSKCNWEDYNKDVRFTGDVRAVTKSDKVGRHTTLTFTATESIYNLPVISHKSVLSYTYRPGVGYKSPKFKSSLTNLNGAFAVTHGAKDSIRNGSGIWGVATWKYTPLYKSAGTAPIVKQQTTLGHTAKFSARLTNR
ncbi:hypothetical protein ACFZCL_32390 [Streptomyces sp. NPDC008159]|uniref:hypothetical protein n=1 Tax=Streptomyces sp. NPDC008159 TaxID=3364817 RepID=UPI0036EF4AB0